MEHIQAALQKAKRERGQDRLADHAAASLSRSGDDAIWANLPLLKADPKLLAKNRLVTASRSNPAHAQFDIMRTKVLQSLRQNNWNSIAITSPTPACGKTMVALNLAFSLAHQKDCRTIVIDLDLRRPRVASLLGLKNPPSMEKFLKGESPAESVLLRYGENVAIAANNRPVRYAAELLLDPETAKILKMLKQRMKPDVVIFDMPPMLSNDDVMAFLPNVDCVILVAAAEASTFADVDVCEHDLSEKSKVLGIVLNKCRYSPEMYGY